MRLKAFGDLLQRRQPWVLCIQWLFVGIYLVLLLLPLALPEAAIDAHALNSLARFASALFWGIWWPLVILTTLCVGQVWCGVFCPEGLLSERLSWHGRSGKIPSWLRRPYWPLLLFCLIELVTYMTKAFNAPSLTLLVLGVPLLLAVMTGYFYGRGKRVWCRYVCPVSSVFSLLSRCAVWHFSVDKDRWDAAPRGKSIAVDCPQLLDVRRLRSNEKCSMCGRCSGYRGAVELRWQAPGAEIVRMPTADVRAFDAFSIAYVLFGLCFAVLYANRGAWPLLSMLACAALLGSLMLLPLWLGAGSNVQACARLAYALIPVLGLGVFLGAVQFHSLPIFYAFGMNVQAWQPLMRLGVLGVGLIWSLAIGWQLLRQDDRFSWRPLLGFAAALMVPTLAYWYAPL